MEKNITSIVKDVVFLDIETSGLNPKTSEILEIGAVKIDTEENISIFNTLVKNKFKVLPEIFSLCKNLNQKDLDKAPLLDQIKEDFLDFIEDKTIICHNKNFEKEFLSSHIGKINNKFIDSMELAAILEPFHREFNLDYLKKAITKNKEDEAHRAIYDVVDTIDVVNALILRFRDRLEKDNKLTLYPLTFEIDSYLNKHSLGSWDWSEYINNANYDLKDDTNTVYEKDYDKDKIHKESDNSKEEQIFKLMGKYDASYEELLKEKDIWGSKKGFIYEFRQGQYDLTRVIRETFHNNTSNIACIEAPTGIGKSVGYLLPAVLEARYSKKRIIISTATKELQVQLMDKDLPNVINSLGLSGKVSYGYIKGKNNYICKSKFYDYKKDYETENPTYEDILSIVIIENLIKDGKYGDIEEINYWVLNHFKELQNHLRRVVCDVDLCKPKKCHENCLYKKRVEELKDEDITVVNHSLLARWPYVDEKPLENIIVDEAHNLIEKGYDFFSQEVEHSSFRYFLKEIYPSEFSNTSRYYNEIRDRQKRTMKPIDRFYTEIKLDRDIKQKISRNINFIFEK
ncbi:MAG: exonuclease domain-containing protein, partial [Intestinibacter sp.]